MSNKPMWMKTRTVHGGLMTMQDVHQADITYQYQGDTGRIVDAIRDIDPNLDVAYLDPDKGGPFDAPYAIFEWCRDGVPRLLFSVWELNWKVLERIHAADTTKFDVQGAVDLANEKAKKDLENRKQERFGEAKDIVKHVLDDPKTSYTFKNTEGEVVKLQDDYGIVKRDGRDERV